MKHHLFFLLTLIFTLFLLPNTSYCQNDDASRLQGIQSSADEDTLMGWIFGGGIGIDLGNILVINPRPGAGQNRIGLGGASSIYTKYKQERFRWNNNASLNFSIQKQGSGELPYGEDIKVPFEKSIDELRLNSNASYDIAEGSKWSYASDFTMKTQLTPSYRGDDGRIYLKDINVPDTFVTTLYSKFLAPGRFNLGVGIKYQPVENFSLYYSPLTGDLLVISDQEIANLGIHGTELEDENVPGIYKQTRWGLGSNLKAKFSQTFLNERLSLSSALSLFSDYLHDPQNIDLDWTNELAFEIFKGINLSILTSLNYDDDVKSNITDFDSTGGLKVDEDGNPITRPAVNYFHQIVLKYTRVF